MSLKRAWRAGEMRAFDLGSYVIAAYKTPRAWLRGERLDRLRKHSRAPVSTGGRALIISGARWRGSSGALSRALHAGRPGSFLSAFNHRQSLLRSLLANLGEIYSNSLFLDNLFEFLALESRVVDSPAPVRLPAASRNSITFRDVTFRYPGSERTALRDFNLEIPAGRTVANVGANGAGKSTLLKLLCRFYDPTEGRVEFDGSDLREVPVDELRQQITVLFQFLRVYYTSVGQNIALGNLNNVPSQSEIEAAARAA